MLWFKTKNIDGKNCVFDPLRQQYVTLTPEEEVEGADDKSRDNACVVSTIILNSTF